MTKPVALVTGATPGIGRVTARVFAEHGFAVVVTGRTMREGEGNLGTAERPEPVPGSIESVVAEIRAAGGEAFGVRLDILDRSSIDAAFESVMERFGRIDVLFNNAVYQGPELMLKVADFSMQAAEDAFRGSVINQAYLSRRAIAAMQQQGRGRIIFISTLATNHKLNGVAGLLYIRAKAALNKLASFIQFEHAKDGILAFLVEPQFTMTDTMGRSGRANRRRNHRPEETAEAVAWLASHPDAARFAGGEMINAPDFFATSGIDPCC